MKNGKRQNSPRQPRYGGRRYANREFRQAAAHGRELEPFGIRRKLETRSSQQPIHTTAVTLVDAGEIDPQIVPRRSLHVTEMPKVTISSQMSRGIVFGYELALRVNRKREQLEDEYDNQIVVEIGKSAIFKKGNLGFRVHSDELEREYHDIRVMMGRLGVRGTMRDVEPLHITWGDAPRRVPWNIQMEAVEIMEEVRQASKDIEADSRFVTETGLYIPPKVLLDPLEFYPGKY